MAATLESALVILDRASEPVRGIRREVRGLQGDAEKAGKALDDMAGPKAAADLQKVAEDTKILRGALRGVRDELPLLSRQMDVYDRRLVAAGRDTDRLVASTDRLAASLRGVGAIDARPSVHLDGIAESRAELAALRRDLDSFGRQTATARARILGSSSAGAGGGGGVRAPRTQAYFGSGGSGIATSRLGGLGLAGLLLGQPLLGAAGAIGGSAVGAGLGAGAVGIAGGGVLGAGIGSIVAIAKPATKALTTAMQAQTKYNAAVDDFGRSSKQAANAKREMDQAFGSDQQLRRATTQISAFRKEWTQLTAPGRAQFLGLIGDVAQIGQRAAPRMARNANAVARSARTAGTSQARFLAGNETQNTLAALTQEFARDLPVAEHSLENVELIFERIARASLPFFHEGMLWIDKATDGWEQQTRDVTKLRTEVGGFVNDLKDWGALTHSAFELAKDVLMGGRPAGGSAVEDLTKTLDSWDKWVQHNPEKMDAFFKNAVTDTEKIAGSVVDIVHGLDHMATELRPLLSPLERLASLFGSLSGAMSPGVAATALLGVRGMRNSIAGRGGTTTAAGAGGVMPLMLGGGGAGALSLGARLSSRGAATYAVGRELGAGRLAAGLGAAPQVAGGAALRGAGALGRFALPALAIGGLSGAFGPSGSNPGNGPLSSTMWGVRNTAQGALAMFGLAHPVLGTDDRVNRGSTRAQAFVSQLPGGASPTTGEAARAAKALQPELASAEQKAANSFGNANNYAEALSYLKALRAQAQAYKDIAKEAGHAADVERNQQSRDHAAQLTTSFGKAYDILDKRMTPEAAMDKTLKGVYSKMQGMNRTGAKILGENVLGWAREQAKANPQLTGEVDWLQKHIEASFSKMGDHVLVVNGQILTGSAKQWKSIGAAITDPANLALSQTSAAFQQLRNQALGELKLMGYSDADAAAVFKGVRSGAFSPAAVSATTGTGQPLLQSNANLARQHGYKKPLGDGIGDGPGTVIKPGQHGAGSSALMGANAGLGMYAADASRFGLHVTSGLRPGAVTSSGNTSLHATGNAIDESGSAGGMLRYARFMSSKYGGGLDELIHTPLGYGIKNGRKVPLSFWGSAINAQHQNHVHVGDRTPGGPGGALSALMSMDTAGPGMHMVNLKGPRSGLGGVPGALADGATGAFAAALSQKINALGGGVGGGGSAGGGLSGMIAAAGLPSIFNAIVAAESGGNPSARNPSGAIGLTQLLGHQDLVAEAARRLGLPADPTNPRVNLAAADLLYQQNGLAPWAASRGVWGRSGDGMGWDRPALGGGPMNITVGGSRGHTVQVSTGAVQVRLGGGGISEAHVQSIVSRQLNTFVDHVLEELEHSETAGSVL